MKKAIAYKKRYYLTFTFYFLGFGVIVALLTSLINYNASFTDINKKLQQTANIEMKFKREFLSEYISQFEMLLSSIARNELTVQYLKTGYKKDKMNLTELFYALSYANRDIMQLRYLDTSGKEVIRIDRDKKSPELLVIPENQLQDKSQRYYFKETSLLMANQFWHSNIDLNIEQGKIEIPIKPTFRIATIVVVNNQFKGIIIVNLLIEDMLETLANSANFQIYLIDKEGEVIHHPEPSGSWSRYLENRKSMRDLFPEFFQYILNQKDFYQERVFSHTLGDLFKNRENLKIVFIPKFSTMKQMQEQNIIAALLIAGTVLLVSIPLSWIVSITPSKLQSKLAEAYKEIREQSETIDKNVMIAITDKKGTIKDVSSNFTEVTGYLASEIIGKNHNFLQHPETPPGTYQKLWETISSGRVWKGEIKNLDKNGQVFWVHQVITPKLSEEGEIIEYIGVSQNITDKKNIELMSITDNLTGLFNRRKLVEVLNAEMARTERHKSVFSIIIFDIDFFKKVNDTYGHQAGDDVLVNLADILKENARETDCVSRWGGEEFLIVAGGSDLEGAYTFAEKLRKKVESYNFPAVGKVTISCGVAEYEKGETSTELVLRADTALYKVKESGRNSVAKG